MFYFFFGGFYDNFSIRRNFPEKGCPAKNLKNHNVKFNRSPVIFITGGGGGKLNIL